MKEIPLTRGYVALVDDEDFERVNQHKWRAHVTRWGVYAIRTVKRNRIKTGILMHCFIKGAKGIDHADANSLNNQKYNLRPCNDSQNQANRRKIRGTSSQYKGVHFRKGWKTDRWIASIKINRTYRHLGSFRDEADAARAYNIAAGEAFGEFARLNVIPQYAEAKA